MKRYYDFSKGKRGAVVPVPPGKTRITIRLDNEVLDWFRSQVEAKGGGSYQSMINGALREFIEKGHENLEDTIKRALLDTFSMNKLVLEANTWQGASALSQQIRRDIPSFKSTATEVAQSGLKRVLCGDIS
jgi:Arc/MetJ-type ribon-helix-helix transcriptional regulator